MKKKLINLMVILVMMLCFYVLTGCDSISISDYKATKITELQAYADAKGVDNYTAENWLILQQAVTDGKTAVEVATNKAGVDAAFKSSKDKINRVQKEGIVLEEKIIWNGTISDEFDDETILITIDKNFKAIRFEADDFVGVNVAEIARLSSIKFDEAESWPEDFTVIYTIKIGNKGKQNLINAIRELEKLDFIRSASPNSFDSPDNVLAIIGK